MDRYKDYRSTTNLEPREEIFQERGERGEVKIWIRRHDRTTQPYVAVVHISGRVLHRGQHNSLERAKNAIEKKIADFARVTRKPVAPAKSSSGFTFPPGETINSYETLYLVSQTTNTAIYAAAGDDFLVASLVVDKQHWAKKKMKAPTKLVVTVGYED